MVKLLKYEDYKDSDVDWISSIPAQWEVKRFKFLLREINIRSTTGNEQLLSLSKYSGVVPKGSLEERAGAAESLVGYKRVFVNDLVVNKMQAVNGLLAISKLDGITSPDYSVYRPIKPDLLDYRYLGYLLSIPEYLGEFKRRVTGVMEGFIRLYTDDLYSIKAIFPCFKIQELIANFLDKKTAQIDEAISIKEQQIALLKERKQIIIKKAVTQGLDPNVPMKDSGVDWIGKIPAHWNLKKLRYLGVTQNGISAGAEYFGEGFPFVSYGDVYKNRQLPELVTGLAKSTLGDQKLYSVLAGDVFFTRTSETVDEIGFASICFKDIEAATFAGFLIRFRPYAGHLVKEFSKYYFNAAILRKYFVKEMNLVIRASLSQELLKNLSVPLPPVSEQLEIYQYLEQKSDQIDEAISIQISQIEKLKEYKTALINSAVTGKIKVTPEMVGLSKGSPEAVETGL